MINNTGCGCDTCQHELCVQRVPIFSALDQDELGKVVKLIKRRTFLKGELLVMEENQLEGLIIINSGRVKTFKYTSEGKEQILYIFSEGDFFGEKNLLQSQRATYNVQALEDTNVCLIYKKDFQKLLHQYSKISLKVIEELCNRLERLEHTVQDMGTKDIEARVSSVLLEFIDKYGRHDTKGILIKLPLSREGIANYIGVARETVSRKLSLLQEEGVIKMIGNKKILILDKEKLE